MNGSLEFIEQTPVTSVQISHTKTYKSRDGRPVRIYVINQDCQDFPVLAAIKDDRGFWVPRVYNDVGIAKVPYGPNNDIVSEWSEG